MTPHHSDARRRTEEHLFQELIYCTGETADFSAISLFFPFFFWEVGRIFHGKCLLEVDRRFLFSPEQARSQASAKLADEPTI